LEDLEESLEKKAKEVERVMELKDEEVSALKTDLVSCSLWSRLVANDIKLLFRDNWIAIGVVPQSKS